MALRVGEKKKEEKDEKPKGKPEAKSEAKSAEPQAKAAPPVEEVVEESAPVLEEGPPMLATDTGVPLGAEEPPVAEEPMPMDATGGPQLGAEGGGVIDPIIAGYKGPEMGPFMCGNCIHFNGDGSCSLLAAPVDEMGMCNLFTPVPIEEEEQLEPAADPNVQEPMPEGEPYPAEEEEASVTA